MSLLDDLGYRHPKVRWFQRPVHTFAATRVGAWFFQKTAHHADRFVHRLTSGRSSLISWVAGRPVLLVTTKGAKSGLARTVPLVGIPIDGGVALIGSNYGQRSTPGWVHNLVANPEARVAYRDRVADVRARLADTALADRVFEEAATLIASYATYRARASHREIKVFVLESVADN